MSCECREDTGGGFAVWRRWLRLQEREKVEGMAKREREREIEGMSERRNKERKKNLKKEKDNNRFNLQLLVDLNNVLYNFYKLAGTRALSTIQN